MHKNGKIDINANFVFTFRLLYFQFSSLFASYDVSKCEIKYHCVQEDYISRFLSSLVLLISSGITETKLAILLFLCCG